MKLVSRGQQNAVFTDGRYFYRYAHRELLFPRFQLPATPFYAPFEPFCDARIQQQCEAAFGGHLSSGSRKLLLSQTALRCVEIKPKCPVLYRGRELFSYTAAQKQLAAGGGCFEASEVLNALSDGVVDEQLLRRMGRYCVLQGGCTPAEAVGYLNCERVAHVARLLSHFYSWASSLGIVLDEFSAFVNGQDGYVYDPHFLETQRCVASILAGDIPERPETPAQRQIAFQTVKSISDASLIAWDGGAELVDVEMKSMAAKWASWRRTYDGK